MCGVHVNVTCPICKGKFEQEIGAEVYYRVDDSKTEYVPCKCDLCQAQFWFAHEYSRFVEAIPMTESQKYEKTKVVCW